MKILVASQIHADALKKLQDREVVSGVGASAEDLRRLIVGCDALVFRSGVDISADLLSCSPSLKLLIRAGSGLDNIDLDYVRENHIRLERIPKPSADAVAEMAFAMMLALARHVLVADKLTRQGRWAKSELSGSLIGGKVLGIVGAGNIGSRVGDLGAKWGMRVLGCVGHPSPKVASRLKTLGIRLCTLNEVLSKSDFVCLHVPLSDSTRNLIDAKALARMKGGSFLINLARGGVVDEEALLDAIRDGRIRGASLDVHRNEGEGKVSPLAGLPNVILTPHIGAMTEDTQRQIGRRILQILSSFEKQMEKKKPALAAIGVK